MKSKIITQLGSWIFICWIAAKRLLDEKYTYRASALAFTTLLAIVPLLLVIVSVFAILPIFSKLINITRDYILTNFIPASGSIIEHYLESFTQQAIHLPKFTVVFLIFTAIMLIVTVKHTLDDVWGAPYQKKKLKSWILYWLVLILAPIFIGLTVLISTYIFSFPWLANITHQLGLGPFLLHVLSLSINTIMLSTLYYVVPSHDGNWQDSLFGGLTAAILFEVAKKGFAFYLQKFPTYALIYGALATIPLFLVWLYISWLIILYGAILTHTHYLQSKKNRLSTLKTKSKVL